MIDEVALKEAIQMLRRVREEEAPKPDDIVLVICHPSALAKLQKPTGSTYLAAFPASYSGLPIETDDWQNPDLWTAVLHKQKAGYDRYRKHYRPVKAIYLAAQDVPARVTE